MIKAIPIVTIVTIIIEIATIARIILRIVMIMISSFIMMIFQNDNYNNAKSYNQDHNYSMNCRLILLTASITVV